MIAPPSLHHVMTVIPPGGESLARAFYVGLLGLLEIEKPQSLARRGGLWLQSSTIPVHIGIDVHFTAARKAHIALVVSDLDEVRGRLIASQVAPGEIELELPGFRRCYVDDPFGNRVELMQPDARD